MLGFTGTYRGYPVSVQGSGMGQPSLAIYATEMFQEYGVEQLVRGGACGALAESLHLRDIVVAMSAATDSSMKRLSLHGLDFVPADDMLQIGVAPACGT